MELQYICSEPKQRQRKDISNSSHILGDMEMYIPAFTWKQCVCLPTFPGFPGQWQFGRGEELTTFLVQIQNVSACMFNDSLGHHLDGMRKPAVIKVVHEPNLKDEELERRATKVYVCCLHPAQLISAFL